MPNVFAAGIALVMLTLSCALFICKPLYPIINGLLPYVGSGVSLHLHPYLWKISLHIACAEVRYGFCESDGKDYGFA